MKYIKYVFQILVLSSLSPSVTQAQNSARAISYLDLNSLVKEQNQDVEISKLEKDLASERTGYFERSFFPTLNVYTSQEQFKKGQESEKVQPQYGAELSLNIFNSGKDKIEDEIRVLELEKKQNEFKKVYYEQLSLARQQYWNIIFIQEKIKLLQQMLDINTRNLAGAEKRIRAGVATETDRIEFQMKYIELKQNISNEQLQLNTLKNDFKAKYNLNETILTFTDPLAHEHNFEVEIEHSHNDHSFLYKLNELQARTTELSAEKQKREWWPKIDLFAAYNQHNQLEEDSPRELDRKESVVGLRLSLNLSSGLEGRAEARALKKEVAVSHIKKHFEQRMIHSHIENEVSELRLMHDLVHESEKLMSLASKYYKITQDEYARGVKNSPDVLGAAEKLFSSKLSHIEILKNFQIARAHILAKIGK